MKIREHEGGFLLCVQQRTASSASSWSKYLSRQTFVGTPNYMAPEVMLQTDQGCAPALLLSICVDVSWRTSSGVS